MDEEQKNPKDLSQEIKSDIDKELASYMQNLKAKSASENPSTAANEKTPASFNIKEDTPSASAIADSSSVENLIKNVAANEPEEKPAQETPAEPEKFQIPEEPSRKPIVRTYKSDVEETIQQGHVSSINMALAQQNRMRNKTGEPLSLEEKKSSGINKSIIILSIVLVLGGGMAIIIPYFLVQKQAAPAPVVQTVPSGAFMAADVEEKINLSDINLNIFPTILRQRVDQSSIKIGQIKNIYFTEGQGASEAVITSSRFLNLLGANVPPEISRTLLPEYMFGMFSYNGNQRFLILRVGSYDTTFAGMLSWEVNLWGDFKEAFALPNDTVSSSSTLGTNFEVKQFEDATYSNKDARVVKDSSGNVVFLYSIIDNNTVVITTSVDALNEIIARMGSGKALTQ